MTEGENVCYGWSEEMEVSVGLTRESFIEEFKLKLDLL